METVSSAMRVEPRVKVWSCLLSPGPLKASRSPHGARGMTLYSQKHFRQLALRQQMREIDYPIAVDSPEDFPSTTNSQLPIKWLHLEGPRLVMLETERASSWE